MDTPSYRPAILISLECAGCQQCNGTSPVCIHCMVFEMQLFFLLLWRPSSRKHGATTFWNTWIKNKCFQGNHHWISALLQSSCPSYPWRMHGSLPSVLVHCCQRLRFIWHLQVIWNGRASYRDQSCDLRVWEQCEASTRGMNKSISTMVFPISNNSFRCLELYCWAGELGPLPWEDGRLSYSLSVSGH